jgi:hypothetical protein
MFLRSFPYSAVYILEPRLVIVAVAHLRQRPGYWVKRLSEIERQLWGGWAQTQRSH